MQSLVPSMLRLLYAHDKETLFRAEFFEPRVSKIINTTFITVKPVARFENDVVQLRYNVGTRGNGTDDPVWVEDLGVEVVKT